jgi:hypothetical protein
MALIFSRQQYIRDAEIKIREELSSTLAVVHRFRIMYEIMVRERKKTGAEIEEHEQEMFSTIQTLFDKYKEFDDMVKLILKDKKLNVGKNLLSHAYLVKNSVEPLTQWMELLFDRFKRFNENRLPELKEKVDEINATLERMGIHTSPRQTGRKHGDI